MKTVLSGNFEPMAYKVIQAIELESWNVKNTISPHNQACVLVIIARISAVELKNLKR